MLPRLEGLIARRVLLNFRVDPAIAQRLLPAPLEVALHRGSAVAGVCLIRLERLRPKGAPGVVGMSSENMAHRVAIRYPLGERRADGVFIWRRETDRALVRLLGGRLFPGVHRRATFDVRDRPDGLRYDVRTRDGLADVRLRLSRADRWAGSGLFETLQDVSTFFSRGDCGFSCSLRGTRLEGLQLSTSRWDVEPLMIDEADVAFFRDPSRFPSGTVELDGAVLMRSVPHEWRELSDIPEMATA